jgi:hypothetical protein
MAPLGAARAISPPVEGLRAVSSRPKGPCPCPIAPHRHRSLPWIGFPLADALGEEGYSLTISARKPGHACGRVAALASLVTEQLREAGQLDPPVTNYDQRVQQGPWW